VIFWVADSIVTIMSSLSILCVLKDQTTTPSPAHTIVAPVAPLDITHAEGDNITVLGEYGAHSAPASLAGLGDQDDFNMLSLGDDYINANDHQLPMDDDVHQHGPAHHQLLGTPTITSEVQDPPLSGKRLLLPKLALAPALWTSGQKSKAKPVAPMAPPHRSGWTTKPNLVYLNKDEWEVTTIAPLSQPPHGPPLLCLTHTMRRSSWPMLDTGLWP
jgi:hypothetical protein